MVASTRFDVLSEAQRGSTAEHQRASMSYLSLDLRFTHLMRCPVLLKECESKHTCRPETLSGFRTSVYRLYRIVIG